MILIVFCFYTFEIERHVVLKDVVPNGMRFRCLPHCAACCQLSGGYVFLKESEVQAIANFLGCGVQEFETYFVRHVDDRIALVDGVNEECVFLEDNRCSIYEVRPEQCRSFPFWKESFQSKQAWERTQQLCPGIGQGRYFSLKQIEQLLMR